ncbi:MULTISPECIES: hypothetical protein [Methanosarcina]|jgi:hypothetical protein|uniref:Uncharacterized protein n=7 Tax=Methanosarcina mazei TaxID=2209 RepID=A0A0F8SPV2_METMZ|nr:MULTISPECIES: hypothetical protein [Methanosarcina]AKB40547.1 hypothetical protein MSMAW_1556 [Methanosarcina mazei WWM610]AKB64800.1 hypothetical protein MSMAS_1604 [Methanosarcina mazei S-6]AKB68110.1 hypothetical protein MSMAL_1567 [Methanosarcina mazei LYC]AKB72850.1 hypothetical protein MSMAC_2960 [Methanosarcina mazei C16]KKF98721.1 hypothetical protein DU31_18740 [Methanosarcina mazei]
MQKLMKTAGYALAIIGSAYVVKQVLKCEKCRSWSGWHKIKVEDEGPDSSTGSHTIKVEEEEGERKGSRYGSNPIRY